MGTRADFYVGKGKDAEWIGSIAWDGYRSGIKKEVLEATTEQDFRHALSVFFVDRDDVTLPVRGWPWPWKNSGTTDCSYWFFDGRVWEEFDDRYVPVEGDPQDHLENANPIEYPEFSTDNFARGSSRSGIIIIGGR